MLKLSILSSKALVVKWISMDDTGIAEEHGKAADSPWEDLVVSILSVNGYSLERTYGLLDKLRIEGLFDPDNLSRWSTPQIEGHLKAAEFDRGVFMTALFAKRLGHLGELIRRKGADSCSTIISGEDVNAIKDLLLPVNGIGPRVMSNLLLLRGLQNSM